jgi:ankyrin repeat protein
MSLLGLPNEILLLVTLSHELEADINALARTNRRLYSLLNLHLYWHNVLYSGSRALLWAAKHGQEPTIRMLLDAGAHLEPETGGNSTPVSLATENGHVAS